jgi:hypothetical protein
MADKVRTEIYVQDGKLVRSHKGTEAGKDAQYAEAARRREEQEFDNAMGWGGLGGAGKKAKVPKAEYSKQFEEWRAKKAKNAGQKKALVPKTPAP